MKTATLTVSFDTEEADEYVYSAVFTSALTSTNKAIIPSTQTPSSTSYDSAADIMVAEEITSQSALTSLQFSMDRKVSVNKMTLTGLTAGEIISKVEVIFSNAVSGYYEWTGEGAGNYDGGVKKLVFNYNNVAVPSDGKFPVFFIVRPVTDISFESVIVTTDQHIYIKNTACSPNPFEGKTISFACGKFTRFNMGMDGYGSEVTSGTQYTLVESQDDLYSGATYILVATNDGNSYALGSQKNNNRDAVAVTVENKVITIDETILAYPIEISTVTGGFVLKDLIDNKYLYTSTPSSNRLLSRNEIGDDNYAVWSINITNSIATIKNVGNTDRGMIKYNFGNTSSPASLFNSYKEDFTTGVTDNLALYVDLSTCVVKEDPDLSYSTTSFDIDLGDPFTAPVLSNPHSLPVTYASSNTAVATVNSSTGAITIEGAGTATITASFAGDDTYKSGSASYLVNVTDPNANDGSLEKPYTASEAAALARAGNTDEVYVKGIISSIVYPYSTQFPTFTFFISDDGSSNTFEIYKASATSANDFKVGDIVVFKGTLTLFNTTAEFPEGNELISQIKTPRFSPDGGTFTSSQTVTLLADEGAVIRYTTDGSIPTAATGTIYNGAVLVSTTTTIKAIAIVGDAVTGVSVAEFTISSASVVTFTPGQDTGETSVTKSGVTVTMTTMNNASYYQVYANQSMTVTAPSQKKIKSIEFTCTASGKNKYGPGNASASEGSYSYSGNKGTWSGNVNSVTISTTAQIRMTSLTVTYE